MNTTLNTLTAVLCILCLTFPVLQVEAGKTYYLQQKIQIQMGTMKARNSVKELDAADGQKALAKCHLSTSKAKTP